MSAVASVAPLLLAVFALAACATPLDRGESLYRQGDLRGALVQWSKVAPGSKDRAAAIERSEAVGIELKSALARYEKRAQFYEDEGRLAEAVLYYRLAVKIDPERESTLTRVQTLARELKTRVQNERLELHGALDAGDLAGASARAAELERLDPFEPSIRIEIRQTRAATGAEVQRLLESGKRAYATGDRVAASSAFASVLVLDARNERALGYLSYIQRFEDLEQQRRLPPPPSAITQQEILAEGHFRAAQTARSGGEPFDAVTEYLAALSIDPEHAASRRALDELRGELEPSVEKLYVWGKRYFQEQDLHNALRVWRQVLLIDPNHQNTLENVQRAERMLSRLEEIQTDDS